MHKLITFSYNDCNRVYIPVMQKSCDAKVSSRHLIGGRTAAADSLAPHVLPKTLYCQSTSADETLAVVTLTSRQYLKLHYTSIL